MKVVKELEFWEKLRKFMDDNCLTVAQFAKKVGVSYPTIYRYLAGFKPSRRLGARVQAATKNYVTMKDFGYE